MVYHTLNPDSSATLPYKYDKYFSPTDMYEKKWHLFSRTYLPTLNTGMPPPPPPRYEGMFIIWEMGRFVFIRGKGGGHW